MQAENIFQKIPIRELNQRLGSLLDFYTRLSHEGYYLPDFKAGTITADYLFGVLTNKFFSMKRSDIRTGYPLKKYTKIDLYDYLTTEVKKDLGFSITQMPNRVWMETILFSIKPDHKIFKVPELIIPEPQYEVPAW